VKFKHLQPGLGPRSMGWPLLNDSGSGSWLDYFDDSLVAVGRSAANDPAKMDDWVEGEEGVRYQINAQNGVYAKACGIKATNRNIYWTTPEGSG
jgi:hypothetical protein